MIQQIDAPLLEEFINTHHENQYLLVDVRTKKEYDLDHIPGSVHIPLGNIQSDPDRFDRDKKIVFYCRSGSRSKVAAIFVAQTGHKTEHLFNLTGGMMAYSGEILLDPPKMDLFPEDLDMVELMEKAIDLEKGAFLFYSRAQAVFKDTTLKAVMKKMVKAEVSHARSIFNLMPKKHRDGVGFDLFFNACEGRILEGGKSVDDVDKVLEDTAGDSFINILDFAIELEFCAYDLYKVLSQKASDKKLKQMFYALAQAEKKHLSVIVQSLELCDNPI